LATTLAAVSVLGLVFTLTALGAVSFVGSACLAGDFFAPLATILSIS